jgi:hypothetical protein
MFLPLKEAPLMSIVVPRKHGHRGGRRPGAGRKPKPDKADWQQLAVMLRKPTIAQLRQAAGNIHVGEVLDTHLTKHPIRVRRS